MPVKEKSRSIAALLAFFLGCWGAQFFYLDRPKAGMACILFFWTMIPTLVGIFHAFKFSFMSEEKFNNFYAKNRS